MRDQKCVIRRNQAQSGAIKAQSGVINAQSGVINAQSGVIRRNQKCAINARSMRDQCAVLNIFDYA